MDPWLTASTLPDLLLFTPFRHEDDARMDLPTHVRTPEGQEMTAFGEELAAEIERRYRAPVENDAPAWWLFDEASVSVIAEGAIQEIGKLVGRELDVRRFRPNVVVHLLRPHPIEEDNWLGGVLVFGEPDEGPRVGVTMRDVRCSMVNFDPDLGRADPEVLKSIVRAHQNTAGIDGTRIHELRAAPNALSPNCNTSPNLLRSLTAIWLRRTKQCRASV